MTNNELSAWVETQRNENQNFKFDYSSSDLRDVISCLDLTTLNATDSNESVKGFVRNGMEKLKKNDLPNVAAFCVFSNFTDVVKKELKGTLIHTAVVAAAFPHGQASLGTKVTEVTDAAINGADDIDIVINRGMVIEGDFDKMESEILAFKAASMNAKLKVILEVCELDLSHVYEASKRAINVGADFIKTSTGKGSSGANISSSLVMCKAIKEHYNSTGLMVGFKAAGGISTSEEAMQYFHMVKSFLGEEWANQKYFRIGASSLLNNLIHDLN